MLIAGIPEHLTVDECIIGLHCTFIRSGDRAGIAMTYRGSSVSGLTNGTVIGKPLKEIASGMKSWDMLQASMGVAACNAWYNNIDDLSAEIGKNGIEHILTGHCTGEHAYGYLHNKLGNQITQFHSGFDITIV